MAQFYGGDRNELHLSPREEADVATEAQLKRDITEYVTGCVESGDEPCINEFIAYHGYNPTDKGYDEITALIEWEVEKWRIST